MPTNLLNADIAFPNLAGKGKTDEKFREVESYLFMLLEQLRYTLSNLGQDNFNQTEVKQFSDGITEPINIRIEEDEGNLSQLKTNTEGISIGVQTGEQGGVITLTNPVSGQTSDIILNLGTQSGTGKLQLTAGDVTLASTGAITFGTSGSSITLREGTTQIAATGAIGIGTSNGKLEITDGGVQLATSGTLAISAKSGAIVFSEGGSQICASGQLAISAKTGQIVFSEGGTTIASSGTLSFGTNGSSITLKEGTTQIAATGAIGIGTSNGKLELTDGGATLATSGTLAISAKSGAIVLSEGGSQICSSGTLAISAATGSIVMSEGGTTIASSGQLSFGVNGSQITLREGNTQIAATGAIGIGTSGGKLVITDGGVQLASSGTITFGTSGSQITLMEGTTQIAATGALTLGVQNNEGYSVIQLKDGNTTLATSGNITLGGNVIFASNLTDGTTRISGDNILTGTITGININGGLHASELYRKTQSGRYYFNRAEFDSGEVAFYYVGRTSNTLYGDMATKWQYGELFVDYDNGRLYLRTTPYTNGAITAMPDLKIESAGNLSIDANNTDATVGTIYIGNSYTEENGIVNNQTIVIGKTDGATESGRRLTKTAIEGDIMSWNVFTSLAQDITDTSQHTYDYTGWVSGFVVIAYLSGITRMMSVTIPILTAANPNVVTYRIGTDASYIDFTLEIVSRPANMFGTGQIRVQITGRDNSNSKIARLYRVA